jgi:glycylpeptide N-tetradecanoyltransferase
MHNTSFLETLKFGKGDGVLHYYMYNYKAKDIENDRMGLVMM